MASIKNNCLIKSGSRDGSAKKRRNKSSRDNQHIAMYSTSLHLLFSSDYVILLLLFTNTAKLVLKSKRRDVLYNGSMYSSPQKQ